MRQPSAVLRLVRAFYSQKESYHIFRGSTNSTRPVQKQRVVDISALSNVIRIDPASKTATVEPSVPMDKLVEATLGHGLIPPVVVEFPGITVGGGYAGSAGESSSFKYGYFDQTINSVEMVSANGEIVTASKTEHPDLFKGAAGALGTLGITTLIELQLVQAKKFVKITYHRRRNVHDTIHAIHPCYSAGIENPSNDYVDGIIFSQTHGVVITGQLTDDISDSAKPQTFSRSWDPWFYLRVKQKTISESLSSPSPITFPWQNTFFDMIVAASGSVLRRFDTFHSFHSTG
jgi:delta24-sterol reductase